MTKKIILSILFTAGILYTSAQLKIGEQPTLHEKSVALDVKGSEGLQGLWLSRVSDTSITGIRAFNPPDGVIIFHPPSGKIFFRSDNAWKQYMKAGISTITTASNTMTGPALTNTIGNAGTDFIITSSSNTATWNLRSASVTARGIMNFSLQKFAGAKSFNNGLTANNGSTLNGSTTVNNGLSVNGSTSNTSNLTLGVTSATTGVTMTNRVLAVDTIGRVFITSRKIIKTFSNQQLLGIPDSLTSGSTIVLTINIPGADLLNSSILHVSPVASGLKEGTKINWVRVFDTNNIKIAFRAYGISETFKQTDGSNMLFNVTVFEN